MTRGSIWEYNEAVRERYLRAPKKEKGMILDEFTKVIGCHRKAAIRLLHRGGLPRQGKRRGRRRSYGQEVVEALRKVWEASDRLCSKRLKPFIGELTIVSASDLFLLRGKQPVLIASTSQLPWLSNLIFGAESASLSRNA